jgi:CheY-like chemotaxis protein
MPTPHLAQPSLAALVVDDEATIRFLVVHALQIVGFQVTEAIDAEDALAALEKRVPDAILIDARLPGMNGFDLCEKIRHHPDGTRVPILMMTGTDAGALDSRAQEAGANAIIGKPLDLLRLGQEVRRLVAEAASPGGVPEKAPAGSSA